jgi:acyl carrier protein phosphodiesterase
MMPEEFDVIKHFTDHLTIEELAMKYPGSVESHIMIHRKLDAIIGKFDDIERRMVVLAECVAEHLG